MTELTQVFLTIISFFIIFLLAKSFTKIKFCVICVSISLTWITFLVLHFFGFFSNVLILAILMGQSIVGIFYLLENKLPEKLYIFKLPFLLTLTLIAYISINMPANILSLLAILAVLWAVSGVMYIGRSNRKFASFAKQLIECCKKW